MLIKKHIYNLNTYICQKKKGDDMLGIESEHNIVHGKIAVSILAKLLRVQTNKLNQEDLQEISAIRNRRDKNIGIIWN